MQQITFETRSIGMGLVVFLGIEHRDDNRDVEWLLRKLLQMRIFSDVENKMNLSLLDVGGDLLIISQFTLMASTKRGNRPSFIEAANPSQLYPYMNISSPWPKVHCLARCSMENLVQI